MLLDGVLGHTFTAGRATLAARMEEVAIAVVIREMYISDSSGGLER